MIATGMLIQKIARHVHCVRKPPAIGPIAVRPPEMPKKIAIALPRSRSGNDATTIATAAGNSSAAVAPWTTRKKMIQASAIAALGRESAGRRRDREAGHADQHHPLAPEHVAELAAEREQRRQREQVAVDHPLRAGRGQRQLLLDLRDRDRDDRLVDERHRDGEHHRRQHEVLVRCHRITSSRSGGRALSSSAVASRRILGNPVPKASSRAHRPARRWWTSRTAIEPSPTAEATRLTEPEWTSPTAKIPGRLVSRKNGRSSPCAVEVLALDVAAGEQKAVLVHRDVAAQPVGVGIGADEHEQRLGLELAALAGARVGDDDRLERGLALELDDLGVGHQLDLGAVLELVDQVARHRLAQIAAADHQAAAGGVAETGTSRPARRSCRRRRSAPDRRRTCCASAWVAA